MPGIADVGKFAVDQLIGILDAQRYCEIIFSDYPAGAIVDGSLISCPKAEVLVARDPAGVRDVILVTADAQAMTPRGIYEISDYLAELLHDMGTHLMVSLGAYPVRQTDADRDPQIYLSGTEEDLLHDFLGSGECQFISKGVIIGSNGLIPTIAKARFGLDGLVFLAETDQAAAMSDSQTDLTASVLLLDLLGRHYDLPIESEFNRERVGEICASLELKRRELENELEGLTPPQGSPVEADTSLYI
jgi:proteasome assembly chaperone (PAC2) family protein